MKDKNDVSVLLIASFLLRYPDRNWLEELYEVEEEAGIIAGSSLKEAFIDFFKGIKGKNEYDLAEYYVNTFDFTKNNTLYLTFYRFEDKRERGAELLRFKQRYLEKGFQMQGKELPDFLPAILEFSYLSETVDILKEYEGCIKKIRDNLKQENNPYEFVFEAIVKYLGTRDGKEGLREGVKEEAGLEPHIIMPPRRVSVGGAKI